MSYQDRMRWRSSFLCTLLLLLPFDIIAQQHSPRVCLTPEVTQRYIDSLGVEPRQPLRSFHRMQDRLRIIPVVFHIVHQGGIEKIPEHIIHSQIEALNEAFGRYGSGSNTDPVGADTRIRFCLASKNPQGQPTTGINYLESPQTNMTIEREMALKNLGRWDQKRYLNIWVVRQVDGHSTTQGYSYLASQAAGDAVDGIVMGFRFVGRNSFTSIYNEGKTLAHEVGHYLDLRHTWGGSTADAGGCGSDDGIWDTPLCSAAFFAQPPNCAKPIQCGYVRQTENYMDYSTDECMFLFTEGQKQAMVNALERYRPSLISYSNLVATGCAEGMADSLAPGKDVVEVFFNPENRTLLVNSLFPERKQVELVMVNMMGQEVMAVQLEAVVQQTVINLHHIANGMYMVHFRGGSVEETKKIVVF